MNATNPSPPKSDRFLWVLGCALLLAGLALRLPALDFSLWVDEVGSLTQASAADFWASARQDVHPPLYYLLLRGELLFSSSVPVLRLLPVGCGLALALLAIWSCRFSRAGAITAGALAVVSPGLLHHSVELRQYALLYLLLGLALALAVRLAQGGGTRPAQISLALILAAAAGTHLVTIFFLAALLPFLIWPARGFRLAALPGALWPLLPALLLLLWLKFFFVTQPHDLPEGWWLSPVDPGSVFSAFADASGGENIRWLAGAVARWSPLPGRVVTGGATVLAALVVAIAWRPRSDFVSWLLLASALVYWTALVTYSVWFEPIVLARTILPGFLPFFAWLAWGIGHHPHPGWRRSAVLATLGCLALAVVLPVRQMQHPAPGLRGLAGVMRDRCQPGDLLVSLRNLDTGLAHYWPQSGANPWLRLDLARPLSTQLHDLESRLQSAPAAARVWLVYRDDVYFRRDHVAFEAITAVMTRHTGSFRSDWHAEDLVLCVAEPASAIR